MCKISVIIPVYNAEKYIEPCVQSILKQSFQEFELLLIDDGATDKSGEICDTLAETDSRITVFHNDNGGAAAARNYGVQKAKGEYIAFVDSDDTVNENYLEYLYQMALENGADISVCGFRKVYPEKISEQGAEISSGNGEEKAEDNQSDRTSEKERIQESNNTEILCFADTDGLKNLLYQRYFLSVPWGMISKKELWKNVEFPEGTKAEDMGTIYRLFAESKMIVYGKCTYYDYYQRAGNTMFSTMSERNVDYFTHSREMVRYIKENYPGLMAAARSRHFSACFQILSETPKAEDNVKFLGKIYLDIKRIRKYILKDKEAKMRNRIAALISMVSISFLHQILQMYYKSQRDKLG